MNVGLQGVARKSLVRRGTSRVFDRTYVAIFRNVPRLK